MWNIHRLQTVFLLIFRNDRIYFVAVIQPQPFQSQKQDLIAELKMSKDILGIKKMKVERVKMEEKQEKELATEISRQFSVENFVGQVRVHFKTKRIPRFETRVAGGIL